MIYQGRPTMFLPPKFDGVMFNARECRFEAYRNGRMVAQVNWIYLYQCMYHPIGKRVFLKRYRSLPGQWLLEAVF